MSMRTLTVRTCDAFHTRRNVSHYKVTLESDDGTLFEGMPADREWEADLSPRGLARLIHMIQRGITAPPARQVPTCDDAAKEKVTDGSKS